MRELPRTARTVPAVIGCLLALSLTACGSGSGAGPERTLPTTTSPPPRVGSTITGADLDQRLVQALLRRRTATFDLTMRHSTDVVTGSGALRFGSAGTDFRLTFRLPSSGSTKEIQYVAVASKTYLKADKPSGGKSWISLGDNSLSDRSTRIMEDLRQRTDPALMGRSFRTVASFTLTGTRRIGSVQVNDYTAVLSPQQVAAMADGAYWNQGPSIKERLLRQLHGGSDRVVVSVDADWVPQQVQQALTVPGEPLETATVSYRGWGQPVSVVAPDPAQVVDLGIVSDLGG